MANEKDLQKEVVQEEVKKVEKKSTPKAKNLTITELKKQNKALDTQTEHTIVVKIQKGLDEETGKPLFDLVPYKIKIDNVFRKTKQHKLLEDLMFFMNEGNKRLELLDVATPYITLLLIKHFTNLDIPDDIDEAIEVMNVLLDLDIFSEIVNLMPENEVIKMYETLNSSIERMNLNIEEMLKESEKILEKVENKEIKELLQDGEKKSE